LVSELELRGHECICVDLPTDQPTQSATAFASAIGKTLEKSKNSIVVAHSVSGLFLPLVPEYAMIARIVYLAAVLPIPGQSFTAQFRAAPEMFRPDWVGKDPTQDDALAQQYLFHDCQPDVYKWAISTLRGMSAKEALIERSPLTKWPNVPSSYISCSGDRTIDPDWWEAAARERLNRAPIRIASGHAPHVSQPSKLAAILDSLSSS
jgi:pimeloyl-ACP methyl ester carboxylesterase